MLNTLPIANRLIISIYDATGNWPKPYIKNGYPVMLWDYSHEGCFIKNFSRFLIELEEAIEAGYIPYGLFIAPPCTAISKVGAQYWPQKDTAKTDYKSFTGLIDFFESEKQEATINVELALHAKTVMEEWGGRKLAFWALENPVGRMETLVPSLQPFRRLSFQPFEYGDPYTKQTILWGEFNSSLKKKIVTPMKAKSKRHNSVDEYFKIEHLKYAERAKYRNQTPLGFAKAFYQANQ